MTNFLVPCRCGQTPRMSKIAEDQGQYSIDAFQVVCPCGMQTKPFSIFSGSEESCKAQAAEVWNGPVKPHPAPQGWIPACGGTETPFRSRSGLVLLYCWNTTTGEHAYLNTQTDIFLTNQEAQEAMA